MSDFRDRRSVLRAGAALCSVAVAGCLGDSDDDADETGHESDADSPEPGDTDGNGTDPDWETIEEWPQLQYDAHNTGYVHAEAPTVVEELWSVELENGVTGSPVVADGTVYVRTSPGTVHAIEDGEESWSTELSLYRRTEGTPVIHDGILVVPVEGGLVGLDRDGGDEVWEESIADQPGRLTLADGAVFVPNESNEMYAFEAATGEKRWEETAGGPRTAGF